VTASLEEWQPLNVPGYGIRTTAHSVVLTPDTAAETDAGQLEKVLSGVMNALNTDKLLLLHLNSPESTIALLDIHQGIQARLLAGDGVLSDRQIVFALDKLFNRSGTTLHTDSTGVAPPVRSRRWYRRPIPWILVSSGVALLTTGLVLGRKYGRPSPQVPWVASMQVSGAALTAAGIGFFIVPDWQNSEGGYTLGIQTVVSF
jgi:hypothetical protein